jgi:hypothetical protein
MARSISHGHKGKARKSFYSIGNVRVKVVTTFDISKMFDEDGEVKEDSEKRIDDICKKTERKLGKKKNFFRLQMGSNTTLFKGDRKQADYSSNIRNLLERFLSTMAGSDLGERLQKIPKIKIISFSDKKKTVKHAKAVSRIGKKIRTRKLKGLREAAVIRKQEWREKQRKLQAQKTKMRHKAALKGWRTRRANKNVPF